MIQSPTLTQFLTKPMKHSVAAAVLGIASVSFASPVFAQEQQANQERTLDLDAVAFSVNGVEYTNQDLSIASVDFAEELQRVAPQERRGALINILIDMILIAEEGENVDIRENELFKRRMDHLNRLNLRNFYVREKIQPQITEELLQEQYVQRLARFEPEDQIRARHILVASEDEAKALIKEVDGGKDFAELAKEKSTGPSGPNGGDLGFFRQGQMVQPFYEAASKLKPGEHTKDPVKTQFGWHVIKVEEVTKTQAPTYEAIVDQLRGQVFADLYQAKVTSLRQAAKVEIAGEPVAPASAEPQTEEKAE